MVQAAALALTLLCVSLAADIDRGNDSSDDGVLQRCTSVDLGYPRFDVGVETVVGEVHCETVDLVEVDLTRGRLARFASLLPRVGRMR
jgi:hypothetical protein